METQLGEIISKEAYRQYHLIRTTVNFLVVMVLTFSQNFSSNGPYVVLNFCKFSDTGNPPLTQFSNNMVLGQIFVKFGEFLSILSIKSKHVLYGAE